MEEGTIEELDKRWERLEAKNAELSDNLNHAVHLCYNLIKGFYPILGLRTRAVVDLCKLA